MKSHWVLVSQQIAIITILTACSNPLPVVKPVVSPVVSPLPTQPIAPTTPVTPTTPVISPFPTNPTGPDFSITGITWGQSVMQADLRLVAGKPALLRVDAVSNRAGLSVIVNAVFEDASGVLGTVALSAPGLMPTTVNAASLTNAYRTVVPAAWVKPGLSLKIVIDPSNAVTESNESNNEKNLTPNVGAGTVLYVTVVPIVQNGKTGIPPSNWQQVLQKLWPLKSIDLQLRPPYATSYVLQDKDGNGDWENILNDLSTLRVLENSDRYYYGFANVGYGSGVAGIAYVGNPVGLGWDKTASGPEVAAHEIGHNFGLAHAPARSAGCQASGVDSAYPNRTGLLDTYGIDVETLTLYAPSQYSDIMSYCTPNWVSSYMYQKAQSLLEANPPTALSITALRKNAVPTPALLIAGRIQNGSLQMRPLEKFQGTASIVRPGDYTLKLETASGNFVTPFGMERIAHSDTTSFAFSVPDHGDLQAVEIWHGAERLMRQTNPVKPLSVWMEPTLTESNLSLIARWDTTAFATMTLTHVALNGDRTVLGLQLTGGQTTLNTAQLPTGGRFELGLSDGLNSVQRSFQRSF